MKLYNTLTKKKEEFVPLQEGKVTVTACLHLCYRNISEIEKILTPLTFCPYRHIL